MTRPDVGVMRELLAKVKLARGPDRRLDYEIFTAFATPGEANPWDPAAGHFYTASIDVAAALVAKVLPNWWLQIKTGSSFQPEAWCEREGRRSDLVRGETEALAICAALLTALIAAEDQAHG